MPVAPGNLKLPVILFAVPSIITVESSPKNDPLKLPVASSKLALIIDPPFRSKLPVVTPKSPITCN